MENTQASLTIIMPTYNQEPYIKEALDSIFMQQTQYSYHIIIADDCSKDKTLEIVRTYQKKYPNTITILESTQNQKLFKNIVRAYAITKTEYFCVLDPDDFWLDKEKIEKALNFLESHKDFTIYAANTRLQYDDGSTKEWATCGQTESNFANYLEGRAVLGHTSSCVFRNVIFKHGLPQNLITLEHASQEVSYRGDSFRNIIHIHEGKAMFVPEIDSVYRITKDGIWQSLDSGKQLIMNCLFHKDMWLLFDKKYIELLRTSYKLYKQFLQPQYIQNLEQPKDDIYIYSIYELAKLYKPYNAELEKANAPTSLKYKVFLRIYRFLEKKLKKRGFVI